MRAMERDKTLVEFLIEFPYSQRATVVVATAAGAATLQCSIWYTNCIKVFVVCAIYVTYIIMMTMVHRSIDGRLSAYYAKRESFFFFFVLRSIGWCKTFSHIYICDVLALSMIFVQSNDFFIAFSFRFCQFNRVF